MVAWTADGHLAGYDNTTRQLETDAFLFVAATVGSVPLNGVTRLGLPLTPQNAFPSNLYPNKLVATAPIQLTSGDLTTYGIDSNHRFRVNMYIAADSAFAPGAEPTPSQIRDAAIAAGGSVFASTTYRTVAGSQTYTINGPRPQQNTRYWVALCPVRATVGSSINSDTLISPSTMGKALSIWANRTPAAPTITSPASGVIVSPGDSFNLTYVPADPDQGSDDSPDHLNLDLAGVEFQYAAVATAANPAPEWMPMAFKDILNTGASRSWDIIHTLESGYSDNYFSYLREDLGAEVFCATDFSDPGMAGKGVLPSGDWQIRCRTFDFGHPYPEVARPGNATVISGTGGLNPNNFPATNTSAWSTAVRVSVPAQVPPPLAISPKDDVAVTFGTNVTLSWVYRNTFVPPFAQTERTVQIKRTRDEDWTTVFSGAGAGASVVVTDSDFTFDVSTRYEWRVSVEDADGEISDYSSPAKFWMVPAPASGDERPVTSENIDGATLGCGTHTVEIYRRGGLTRVGVLTGVSHVDWSRLRDEMSTAKVVVSSWDLDCGNLLAQLQTWAYELVIWRDNGFSRDRVWEGPITLLTYEADSVSIDAKDVMGYGYRRILKQLTKDTGLTTVVDRARRVIQNSFAADDPNVLSYLQVISNADDSKAYRTTAAYSRTAYEEVDDLAANAGLDYTVVGRSILLWGTKHRIGTLPEFTDNDLGNIPIVSEYGMRMSNRYVISNGDGIWGEATRLDDDGLDPIYGLVEMLSTTADSEADPEEGELTGDETQKIIQSFASHAERAIADQYPPPVVVRIPDNTTINAKAVVSIQQLVPGVVIPLRSSGTLREVIGNQKLDSVKVVEENGKETVSITLSAFNRDDLSTEAEEG